MNYVRKLIVWCGLLAISATAASAQSSKDLRVYVIDVEGGQSTLFVTPAGQSLLIDTGWPDNNGRDADRIVAAAKKAGINKIDYVLITHYHTDHVGGVPQLTERIPIGTFIDHGPNYETSDKATEKGYEAYQKLIASGKYKRITPMPGDVLPIKGMKALVISSNGDLIDYTLPDGGEQNPYCKISETRPADKTENSHSLGVLITFGKTRILDLGDLTWDKEMQLMCPINKLGHIPVLIVSHHGWYQSSSPALVDAIHPQIAFMDNGASKGGSKPTLETFKKVPGLEALWQLHYSIEGGPDNTDEKYIANLQGTDTGNDIEFTLSPKGALSVLNSRTGAKFNYAVK
jgi:beta-lactamase superfamily II metal-dependent hydrolase